MAQIEQAPPDGGERRWTLTLPPPEAALLAALPEQLSRLLSNPDSNRKIIDRLFPASYSDPAQQREHRELLGSSLLENRRELLADIRMLLASGARSRKGLRLLLGPGSTDQLLRFLNDMRLVLATDLGVEKNLGELTISAEHPEAPKYALLVYLGGLESVLVEMLIGDPGF
jgi:Domain of unknown function (DUF2017)